MTAPELRAVADDDLRRTRVRDRSVLPELWIFGYGSLMWRPGFPHDRAERARIDGWRRCFCIYSTHHRGSPERPGLVLGLDRGGACEGIAFRVPALDMRATLSYLRQREQVNGVYREAQLEAVLPEAGHRHVSVRAFIVERAHPSYAGRLDVATQARLIRAARGRSGCNLDYLINTLAHLEDLGIREPELERVAVLAGPHFARIGVGAGPTGGTTAAVKALRAACQHHRVRAPRMRPAERRRFLHRRQIAIWHEHDFCHPLDR